MGTLLFTPSSNSLFVFASLFFVIFSSSSSFSSYSYSYSYSYSFYYYSRSSLNASNVRGKFSLRLVPGQDPHKIHAQVRAHLEANFKELGSPNRMTLVFHHGGKAWKSDPDHPNYLAGRKVSKKEKKSLSRAGRVFFLKNICGVGRKRLRTSDGLSALSTGVGAF
jgi:hypothetical protein